MGSYLPLFPIVRAQVASRLREPQFEKMVTYLIGPEEQRFYVHPNILRASSKRFNPPIPPDVAKVPSGDPDTFQTFLEWLYFQIVPSKYVGFEHLLNCYHFAELFEVVRFADALMSKIILLFIDRMPMLDELHLVYDKLKQGSPLRDLLIDLMVWDADRFNGSDDDIFPPELIKPVLKIRESMKEDEKRECRARPWLETPEFYMLQEDWNSYDVSDTTPSNDSSPLLQAVDNTPGYHLYEPPLPRPVVRLPLTPQVNHSSAYSARTVQPSLADPVSERTLYIVRVPCPEIKAFFTSSAQNIAACYWREQMKSQGVFAVKFYDSKQAKAAFNALAPEFKKRDTLKPNQKATRPYIRWADAKFSEEKWSKVTLKN